MAQTFFPINIVTNRINTALTTRLFSKVNSRANSQIQSMKSLIFHFPGNEPAKTIRQILISLGEHDEANTNLWNVPQIYSRLVVVKGYLKDVKTTLFDPYFTPANVPSTNAGQGYVPFDAYGVIANVDADSDAILFDRIINYTRDQKQIDFEPGISVDDEQNLTVIFTPIYPLDTPFFTGASDPVLATPAFGSFIGVNTVPVAAGGIDRQQQPIHRTLTVRGC